MMTIGDPENMENTMPRVRQRRGLRLGAILAAFATIAGGTGLDSQNVWARHSRSHSPSDALADPCTTLGVHMNTRLESMRKLKKTIDDEQSLPDTMEGVFDLMQGKRYVDNPKTEKLARMRVEADDLNKVMLATGCTPVDIDQELLKPPTPTIR
jgi:hypothetical protein